MATKLRGAKATLRQELKKTLASITPEEKKRQSEIVVKKVLVAPWFQRSQRISLFLSMPDEVDTFPLLKASFAAGKECFIPHYKGRNMTMVKLSCLEEYDHLPVTRWNIKQHADDKVGLDALETGGLDVIFMPGLAFTKRGDRLGRGKGYYDNYLTKYQNAGVMPHTVALIFYQQLVELVPVGNQDMPVQEVVYATPDELKL